MTGQDRAIRRGAAAAVLLVALIAATVSFIHIRDLAATHGQTPLAAVLLPFSIDGTVVAASLVLLRAARTGITAPWLAQVMLLSSVLATLAANVAYGAASGVTGALISGWPAYAFIGCAEMALMMVRRSRGTAPGTVPGPAPEQDAPAPAPRIRAVPVPASAPAPARPGELNGHGQAAAELFADDLARGEVPGIRRIRRDLRVGQPRATEVRAYLATVAAASGGQP